MHNKYININMYEVKKVGKHMFKAKLTFIGNHYLLCPAVPCYG